MAESSISVARLSGFKPRLYHFTSCVKIRQVTYPLCASVPHMLNGDNNRTYKMNKGIKGINMCKEFKIVLDL